MTKLYGILALIFSGFLIIGQVFFTIPDLEYNPVLGLGYFIYRIAGLVILWICLLFLFKRGWEIVKGKVSIEAPVSSFKKVFYYSGGFFLMVSSVMVLGSLVVLLKGFVGAGIGIGFSVLPFVLGIILIETCKN